MRQTIVAVLRNFRPAERTPLPTQFQLPKGAYSAMWQDKAPQKTRPKLPRPHVPDAAPLTFATFLHTLRKPLAQGGVDGWACSSFAAERFARARENWIATALQRYLSFVALRPRVGSRGREPGFLFQIFNCVGLPGSPNETYTIIFYRGIRIRPRTGSRVPGTRKKKKARRADGFPKTLLGF